MAKMGEDHEIRLTVLEHDMARLNALPDLIHAMDKKLDSALSRAECPAPGKCLELDERINSLEMTRAEVKGGWKTMGIVAGLSSAIGGAIGWIIQHFNNTKHP